jgi:hypothetical protein
LVETLGALSASDAYFAFQGAYFEIDPLALGDRFVKNLVHVKTLITNASYDCNIVSSQIPTALARAPGIAAVEVVDETIQVTYTSSAIRTIVFPSYAAGHMVSAYQPAQFADDVARLLAP